MDTRNGNTTQDVDQQPLAGGRTQMVFDAQRAPAASQLCPQPKSALAEPHTAFAQVLGTASVAVVVKLGGAAITQKEQLETLNEQVLADCARQLAQLYCQLGARLVVVHGAGSFGHQVAAAAGVAAGGLHESAAVRQGFAATRASVCKLNQAVVAALVAAGMPAVGLSPCGAWATRHRAVVAHGCAAVAALLASGLVPVLHGDAVLDEALGCTILSGDVIITTLCQHFRPPVVAFLTNVDGIFDRPPEQQGAQLIARLQVDSSAPTSTSISDGIGPGCMAFTRDGSVVGSLQTSSAAHDTTGGVLTKIREAAAVARLGAEVRIARAGSAAAAAACSPAAMPAGWTGTVVHCSTDKQSK